MKVGTLLNCIFFYTSLPFRHLRVLKEVYRLPSPSHVCASAMLLVLNVTLLDRVVFEKLTLPRLVKKSPAFCITFRTINLFTISWHFFHNIVLSAPARQGQDMFHLFENVQNVSGAHPASYWINTGVFFLSGKSQSGSHIELSFPAAAEVNNDWRSTSTPLMWLPDA